MVIVGLVKGNNQQNKQMGLPSTAMSTSRRSPVSVDSHNLHLKNLHLENLFNKSISRSDVIVSPLFEERKAVKDSRTNGRVFSYQCLCRLDLDLFACATRIVNTFMGNFDWPSIN